MFAKRRIYRALGLFFFGLGGLGIAVPLLPTVPLWILAALFFAQSAPELQQRIYDHPQFGNTVRQFVEHRVLSKKSKGFAMAGASAGTGVSLWVMQPPASVVWTVATIMAGVVLWLGTRPGPASREQSDSTGKETPTPHN
nr:YbaN family protein [Gammaproteobacteria bacterium]